MATHLPSDWQPDAIEPGGVTFEIVQRWPPGRMERELARFKDYWAAAAGPKAKKRDWQAAWRTWIGKSDDFGNRSNGRMPQRSSVTEALFAARANLGLD